MHGYNNRFEGSYGHEKEIAENPKPRLFEELPDGRIVLYHASTTKFQRDIETHGLRPNNLTGIRNFRGSLSGLVYMGIPEVVAQYSGHAVGKHGGRPMLLEVTVSDSTLVPDQDSGLSPSRGFRNQIYDAKYLDGNGIPEWMQSMLRIGTCAHEGTIESENIEFLVLESDFRKLARRIRELRTVATNIPTDYRIRDKISSSI
jgi:hypothetical protein